MAAFRRKKDTTYFVHSGDIGDLIYALPAMRAKATGQVGIILARRSKVRHPWDEPWVENARPLLEAQPYISHVWFNDTDDQRTKIWDHDVDPFRPYLIRNYHWGSTIADYVAIILGVDKQCSREPWIEVDHPTYVDGRPVVISRSLRYRNKNFPWKRVYEAYKKAAVFVGTEQEHAAFTGLYGKIPMAVTPTLMDLARLISGCRLFIGNQSLPYAIAEGLKHTTIQEPSPKIPDCMWLRPNASFGWQPNIHLPEI